MDISCGIKFTTFRGSQSGEVVQAETSRSALTSDELLISVTASGLCGGELLFKGKDVSYERSSPSKQSTDTTFWMVLGHEGVGIIAAVDPAVSRLKKGDRVGWCFLQDSCGHCQQCLDGTETFCPERKLYGSADHDQGSLAYAIVKKESRVFVIPDSLPDEAAAPLMCAGASVFNALDSFRVKPTQTIGVVGIGGLGNLAIQGGERAEQDSANIAELISPLVRL